MTKTRIDRNKLTVRFASLLSSYLGLMESCWCFSPILMTWWTNAEASICSFPLKLTNISKRLTSFSCPWIPPQKALEWERFAIFQLEVSSYLLVGAFFEKAFSCNHHFVLIFLRSRRIELSTLLFDYIDEYLKMKIYKFSKTLKRSLSEIFRCCQAKIFDDSIISVYKIFSSHKIS